MTNISRLLKVKNRISAMNSKFLNLKRKGQTGNNVVDSCVLLVNRHFKPVAFTNKVNATETEKCLQ